MWRLETLRGDSSRTSPQSPLHRGLMSFHQFHLQTRQTAGTRASTREPLSTWVKINLCSLYYFILLIVDDVFTSDDDDDDKSLLT